MTEEQLAAMHGLLAKYHRKLAKKAALDVVRHHHADLAERQGEQRLWSTF